MKNVKILMDEPVVISQASPEVRGWGPFQFPEVERLPDGSLHVWYHIHADSATAYGLPKGQAVSHDGGNSFTALESHPAGGDLRLPGGDRLRLCRLLSLPMEGKTLHAPLYTVPHYSGFHSLYAAADFPELGGWPLERLPAGETQWKIEFKDIEIPGELRSVTENVLARRAFWRLRLAPDGAIWAITYGYIDSGMNPPRLQSFFCVSRDNGESFRFLSLLPYKPDPVNDPHSEKRSGYTEPDVAFLPDGSVLCLQRTTDGLGVGPMYVCRSTDGGKTWSEPRFFDDLGVWPTLLTLQNGVTLAVYGRPGLYLRATADPSGEEWEPRLPVIAPGEFQAETCSYADMVALDDSSTYLVYSDFKMPNPQGIPVKTILGRRVRTVTE